MNTTHALRHLVTTLHRMDLPDEQQRPSEAEYLLAVASADAALVDFETSLAKCAVCGRGPHANDDPDCRPHADSAMVLRDGTTVDLRSPWPFTGQLA